MDSLRPKSIATSFAVAAALLASTAASAAIVVFASGPSAAEFPIGKKVGDTERIVLRTSDRVRILNGKGTREMRGPGTYSVDQQTGSNKRNAFAVLTARRTGSRVRTGALRNPEGGLERPPNIWYVDIDHPGTVCVVGTDRVRLWRATTDGDATYSLRAGAGETSHPVSFADGDMLAPWDTQALRITDGASFAIAGPGDAGDATLTFAVLDMAAEEPEALAEQLIEHGCMQQLELLSVATLIEE